MNGYRPHTRAKVNRVSLGYANLEEGNTIRGEQRRGNTPQRRRFGNRPGHYGIKQGAGPEIGKIRRHHCNVPQIEFDDRLTNESDASFAAIYQGERNLRARDRKRHTG